MNALDQALYSVMSGDTGTGKLATLSNGGIWQILAPENTAFNYTVFQEVLDTPSWAFGNALTHDSVFYQIKHYSVDEANNTTTPGPDAAGAMADRARVLLTNPSLSVSGKTVLCCRFNRGVPAMREFDEANNRFVYSKGSIFEVWLA